MRRHHGIPNVHHLLFLAILATPLAQAAPTTTSTTSSTSLTSTTPSTSPSNHPLNFPALYSPSVPSLQCLATPLGVFGFYLYLAQLLTTLLTLTTLLRGSNAPRILLAGLLNLLFAALTTTQHAHSVQSCLATPQTTPMAHWASTALLASAFAVSGDLFMFLRAAKDQVAWAWLAARILHSVSLAFVLLAGFYPGAPLGSWALGLRSLRDGGALAPSLAAGVPILVAFGGVAVVGQLLHSRAWYMWVVFAALGTVLFLQAVTFVGLGRVLGDVWGARFWRTEAVAKVDVVAMLGCVGGLVITACWEAHLGLVW